jgi:hypothetical protein
MGASGASATNGWTGRARAVAQEVRLHAHARRIEMIAVAGRLGLVDPIRFTFGLQEIRDTDIFIVSYPRSGTTWTRFILAYLLQGTDTPVHLQALKRLVPDLSDVGALHAMTQRRIVKMHHPYLDNGASVIYVHRDYRQALVSYWLFCRRLGIFAGTFSEFLRSPHPAMHGSWKASIRACKRRVRDRPESIFLIRYQDLLDDFVATVGRLASWSGVGTGLDLEAVRQRTARDVLAAGEREQPGRFHGQSQRYFFDDGGAGLEWRAYWSRADLTWLARDRALMALMEEFGYT